MSSRVYKETEGFVFRDMELEDFERGYLVLLSQLTKVPPLSAGEFAAIFEKVKRTSKMIVIEDLKEKKVVGSFKLLFERKFARGGATMAHLEDVVVDSSYRSQGFGKQLMELAKAISDEEGCYKMVGYCSCELVGFYAKNGFEAKEVCFSMVF